MAYPANFRYTKQHEWVNLKGDVASIGITDYAQQELGDVVFVELPKAGSQIAAGKSFGTVESVKAVSELFTPVGGEVAAVNTALAEKVESLSADPWNAGWMVKLKNVADAELGALLDADAYEKKCESES